ncbi:MAG: helix-turn-helix domain-containing protein [Parvularculaceae bacterium]|nr:helix-turn-helix domain-containing protein [Parvularculaceae bacterium]
MSEVVQIPQLLTEREAAARLGVSLSTLQRLRRIGQVAFIKIGRLVKYREEHLAEYLEASTCPRSNVSANSEISGSRKGEIRRTGAAPGSTLKLDRHDVKALALQTLRTHRNSSRAG